MQDFQEVHTWPLTSATTCYTGVKHVTDQGTARWATEQHSVQVTGLMSTTESPTVSWKSITTSTDTRRSSIIAVGYSSCQEWEAVALLDINKLAVLGDNNTQSSDPESPSREAAPQHVRRESAGIPDDLTVVSIAATVNTSANNTVSGSASVATTATTNAQQQNHHRRSSSHLSNDTMSSHPYAHPLASNSMESLTLSSLLPDISEKDYKAELVLKRLPTEEEEEEGDHTDDEYYTARLDFRPLSPCVCQFDSTDHTVVTGVWLASADTNALHWMVPGGESDGTTLESVSLRHEPAFVLESPCMALCFDAADKTSFDAQHLLAVACQDGTIRLIHLSYGLGIFTSVQQSSVIVDGPIVCLHIDKVLLPEGYRRHVVAGSLCGYVTDLYESTEDATSWDGPFMVAEGLWNAKLESEDSVLTVHTYNGNCVALGTLLGRCLLYQKYGSVYELVWECRLPYSIHSICHVEASASTKEATQKHPSLLITTRRSVHLFSPTSPRHVAAVAKERLEKLLSLYESEQVESPVQDDGESTNGKANEAQEEVADEQTVVQSGIDIPTMDTTEAPNEEGYVVITTQDASPPQPPAESPAVSQISPAE